MVENQFHIIIKNNSAINLINTGVDQIKELICKDYILDPIDVEVKIEHVLR